MSVFALLMGVLMFLTIATFPDGVVCKRREDGAGLHVEFPNGYTISVQWGPGSYSDNRHMSSRAVPAGGWVSRCAEIAVYNPAHKMIPCCDYENVRGWQSKAQIRALLAWAAAIPKGSIVHKVPEFEE